MFNAMARIRTGIGLHGLLKGRERHVDPFITRHVDGHLEARVMQDPDDPIQGLLGVCGGLALIELFGRRRFHLRSARANYLVFAIALLQLFAFTVGGRL